MQSSLASYQFELANSLPEISRMSDWLTEMLADISVSDELAYAVRLCTVEAVTNIVSYAFAPGTEHRIGINLDVVPDRIVVVVTDDGNRFDPTAHKPAEPAADLASAAIGGLGIVLMRQFATGMSYARQDASNRLELRFAR